MKLDAIYFYTQHKEYVIQWVCRN